MMDTVLVLVSWVSIVNRVDCSKKNFPVEVTDITPDRNDSYIIYLYSSCFFWEQNKGTTLFYLLFCMFAQV